MTATRSQGKTAKKGTRKKGATTKTAARKTAAKRAPARKTATRKTAAKRAPARKTAAKRAPARKTTARKTAAKRAPAKKASTRKKTATSKTTARKSTARKTTTRKTTARKSTARKSTARKTAAGRSATKRAPAKRSTATRSSSTQSAAFRAKRSNRKAAQGKGKRRSAPVTDAGERNAAFLTATVLGLTLFGLVMVLSASSVSSQQFANSPFSQFKRQLIWAGIGAVAFLVASRIDYRRLRVLAKPLLVVSIVLLIALFVPGLGVSVNGSTRWLGVGPFVIQPSELAKLVLIIFIADLLARRERRMDRAELTVRPVMLVLLGLSVLIVPQPKLGTPIIMAAVTLLLLFVAGARMKSLVTWITLAVMGAGLLAYLAPYRRRRLLSFLNPWEDPLGDGLQAIQSQVGIASGGLFGVGLGASRAKWGFLPFAHTDFIFAIVAEEVGLIGASALIGGFLLIAWFGFKTAMLAPDRFGMLLATGITSWLLVQAFLNVGMVLGVLPITGEPLPFVSAGGSSLVTALAAAGLLTSVSRRARA